MILLVIDTQKGITNENLYEFDRFKINVSTLISEARKNGTEVVFVRHDDGPGSGFSAGDEAYEIYEGFAPIDGEKIFDKSVNSAFHASSGLLKYLKDKDEKTVIAVGLMTDFCMDATRAALISSSLFPMVSIRSSATAMVITESSVNIAPRPKSGNSFVFGLLSNS